MTSATTIGFGVPWALADLDVTCSRCGAAVGQPCAKRGGGSHTSRCDKATRKHFKAAHRFAMEQERAALRVDPDGPLWRAEMTGHRCGVYGSHALTECRATSSEADPGDGHRASVLALYPHPIP